MKLLQLNINRRKASQSLVCQCTKCKSLIAGVMSRGKSAVQYCSLIQGNLFFGAEQARDLFGLNRRNSGSPAVTFH